MERYSVVAGVVAGKSVAGAWRGLTRGCQGLVGTRSGHARGWGGRLPANPSNILEVPVHAALERVFGTVSGKGVRAHPTHFPSEGAHCFLPLDPTGYRPGHGTQMPVLQWAGIHSDGSVGAEG